MKETTTKKKVVSYGLLASGACGVSSHADLVVNTLGVGNTPIHNLLVNADGLGGNDFYFNQSASNYRWVGGTGSGTFFGDSFSANYGSFYQSGAIVSFPSDPDAGAYFRNYGVISQGAVAGTENWTALRSNEGNHGWLKLSIAANGLDATADLFVYDNMGGMPTLAAAEAAAAIPEPSGAVLAMLSLGAVGTRRRRAKARQA